ncbi:MAG TPA: hypothetical protein VGG48_07045 [Rhizomicrobium sp.]
MRAPVVIVLVFAGLAAVLLATVLEYSQNSIASYGDGTVVKARPDDPIVLTDGDVADFVCRPGHNLCALAQENGYFARPGLPRLMAILLAELAPVLLLIGALAVAFGSRWGTALALVLAGIFCANIFLIHASRIVDFPSGAGPVIDFASDKPLVWPVLTTKVTRDCDGFPDCKNSLGRVRGYYLRPDVPDWLAILLGEAAPVLLLLAALAVVVNPLRWISKPA